MLQNMNSIKFALVGEMLLLVVCASPGFRKHKRQLRESIVYKHFSFVPSSVPASVRMAWGREESSSQGINSVPVRKRTAGGLDS